eukprot:12403149-Karenia_brevis.AAC.1
MDAPGRTDVAGHGHGPFHVTQTTCAIVCCCMSPRSTRWTNCLHQRTHDSMFVPQPKNCMYEGRANTRKKDAKGDHL